MFIQQILLCFPYVSADGIAVGLTLGWIYITHLSTRVRHSACLSLWWLAVMTHSTLSRIANYFYANRFSYGSDLIAIPEGEQGTQNNKQHWGRGRYKLVLWREKQREKLFEYVEFSETCVQRARDNKWWQLMMWDFVLRFSVAVGVSTLHYKSCFTRAGVI